METKSDIRVHLYALCWNEAPMLPFFFRHYDTIVDRYFIFDHGSTDGSLVLLKQHPKVSLNHFRFDGPSFVEAARKFYNECWKASRGQADWILVCNIDEHLYHPDLRAYLSHCSREGISLIVPEGYQMISETFPTGDQPLFQQVRMGVRFTKMDKPELFAPGLIQETKFSVGRHSAKPKGRVRQPPKVQVKLLHYKYLGLDYLVSRLKELAQGLGEKDIARGWGHKYLWQDQEKAEEFESLKQAAVQIL
jgi:hypothetical protein